MLEFINDIQNQWKDGRIYNASGHTHHLNSSPGDFLYISGNSTNKICVMCGEDLLQPKPNISGG